MILHDRRTQHNKTSVRWLLVFYDIIIYLILCFLLLIVYTEGQQLSTLSLISHIVLCGFAVLISRFAFGVYGQIWRYGGIQSYFRLLVSDALSFVIYYSLQLALPITTISFVRCLALVSMNLLGALSARMIYRYTYKCCDKNTWYGDFFIRYSELWEHRFFRLMSSVFKR